MSEHAPVSASSAERWIHCPRSARLQEQFPDNASAAAAEGTAAHKLAENKLRSALGVKQPVLPVSQFNCLEMEGHTDDYVTFILEKLSQAKATCHDPLIMVEQRVDFSEYVPEGFGTADCIIIADGTLHIIDLKYGQGVLVEATDNPQMQLYALGALELYDGIYDITTVSMTIFQPRRENVSTYTVFKESLYDWAVNILKPVALLAYKGEGEFLSGEWCRFCRASATCRARADEKLALAQCEFAKPPLLSDDEIAAILPQLDGLVAWANDLESYVLKSAMGGKRWPGYKLVAGRSNRKYADDTAVAKVAEEAGYHDIYRKTLLTITEMERLLGKPLFNDLFAGLITKPQGKPTLVSSSDKRPELSLSTAEQDFMEDINDGN
ncbi:hypothetical protein FACS18948_4600 [Clostridia bacterium]|nr:hypothetical protein FACS18948_4600 [Clostridia bacterium]